MSYKTAWDALDDLNNLADFPVIERSIGGAGGGGTKLTDYGPKLVAMFRAVEDEYQAAMDHLHRETTSPKRHPHDVRIAANTHSRRSPFFPSWSFNKGGCLAG
jgi:molybdate transport repressor ModE-like protein